MIRTFRDDRTRAIYAGVSHIYAGVSHKEIPRDLLKRAVRKLFLIDTVTRLEDLRVPPGNRLEALPMGLSVYALARAIGVPRSRINEICHGRQGITARLALRLGGYFAVDPQWFMNMQTKHDLAVEAEKSAAAVAAISPRAGSAHAA